MLTNPPGGEIQLTAIYNLSALSLGLIAWIIGFCLIFGKKHHPWLMLLSFASMGSAMVIEYYELRHRIETGDLSAVMDIYPTMAWVTLVLLTVTVGLNAVALLKNRE